MSGLDNSVQHNAFFLLLAAITLAFFWLLLPFFSAVFWAVILAIIFQPLQRRFERALRHPQQPRGGAQRRRLHRDRDHPDGGIFGSLVNEGAKLVAARAERRDRHHRDPDELQSHVPAWGERILDRIGGGDFDFSRSATASSASPSSSASSIAGRAINLGQNTLRFVVGDGHHALRAVLPLPRRARVARNIRASMPLSDAYNQRLHRQVRRRGAGDGEGQRRHRGDPGHDRRRDAVAARHRRGAALGGADGLSVAAPGGRRRDRLGADRGLPLHDRRGLGGGRARLRRRGGDRARRQHPAPHPGRQGHPAARLRDPRLDRRRPVDLRDQRLRHRPADRRPLRRRLDDLPRGARRRPPPRGGGDADPRGLGAPSDRPTTILRP